MQHPLPWGDYTNSARRAQQLWLEQGYPEEQASQQELIRTPDRSAFERYLDVVKNVFVIVTCTAVLYSLLEAFFFIQRLQNALQEFSEHMTLGG